MSDELKRVDSEPVDNLGLLSRNLTAFAGMNRPARPVDRFQVIVKFKRDRPACLTGCIEGHPLRLRQIS
ncbi:MAG: hypothetical protein ACRESZ_10005 [Methylococcales bacterium]